MKLTVIDGYTMNPGDLSWEQYEKFGELRVFDHYTGDEEEVIRRIGDAEIVIAHTHMDVLVNKARHNGPICNLNHLCTFRDPVFAFLTHCSNFIPADGNDSFFNRFSAVAINNPTL